uniref:Retrovirus-related Pol polyprotein from transposon TNT 1-94 n=1 Tax=Tanacetum cinerariifolium TaxID=118510 RepID=A0A6L2MED5_TANCI|nr:hypothetical protein [Tanacetum cinerariifolium]
MDMTIDQQVALDEALVPHKPTKRSWSHQMYLRYTCSTATVHHHSIRFKMNNKKCIVNLEYFREMLHICPRIPNQTFDELPFEEEILAFLRYLGHSGEIKKITDEDFVYQVAHNDAKKSNEMYYPRFTKVIINFFMTKDPSISRRNKVNWHYVRDDQMFTTIKLVSRHQNTQQFGPMLPVELTNKDIRNSAAYKEYFAIASGAAPPKMKASVRKTQSSFNTTMPPPTAAGTRLLTLTKRKQPTKSSKAKGLTVLSEVALIEAEQIKFATKRSLQQTHISQASGSGAYEGTGIIPGVPDVPTDESDEEISWKSSDEDDDDQDDNDDDQDLDNDSDDFVHPKLSTHDEEAKDEESFDPIVQTSSQVENYDDESNDDESYGINVGGEEGPDAEDDDEELYKDVNINLEGRDVQMTDVHTTQVLEDTHVTLTLVNHDGIDSLFETTHRVDVPVSTRVMPLLVTAPTLPPPSIPIMSQVQQAPVSSQQLLQAHFCRIFQILALCSDESNKSIHRSDEQRNLYKALVDAYECDNIILDTYGDTVTLKRRHDDADKDEEPSAGSDQGSKRRSEWSTSAPKEKASKTIGKFTDGSKSHQKTASESALAEEPIQTNQDLEEPSHQEFKTGAADDQPIAEAS